MALGTIWGLLVLISVVWVLYDIFTAQKSMKTGEKVLWVIIALVLNIIGAVIYYFMKKHK